MKASPHDMPADKVEQELRLEELTASIDGLTNGYFSKRLNKGSVQKTFIGNDMPG